MKKYILILFLSVFCVGKSFAAEQIPDILLVNNDTVFLKTFPLEKLKFKLYPFDYGGGIGSPNDACLRGYQAIWTVVDYKLYLKEIRKIGEPWETVNLKDFFEKNGHSPVMHDGLIFANWYSASLVYYFSNTSKYLYKPAVRFFWDKPKIKFENGLMTINILNEIA
ncbi:hypothetical protein GGR21_002879 [Dysgonomonas hofstadii]|jgi:hypothetical protein|uniref:Uncharacterized protein n=1 Tax=Dysgonomonas hofstadii TaxID=637886 RepID=A0A840CVX8_9BACT|nr:hypothetical protein [Dysgonomonas hofstadii]MBB4036965.1 hypothetical protein [Dysgonomonas hofstadii]